MLAERRYPLIRETLERMMELRLTTESEGEAVFNLLRFIQKQIDEFEGQDRIQKQTTFGKDFSNPFTAHSLLKTIWFSTHHDSHAPCYSNEALAILEKTATGKEISNPFMAVQVDVEVLQCHRKGALAKGMQIKDGTNGKGSFGDNWPKQRGGMQQQILKPSSYSTGSSMMVRSFDLER
ncbi:hypothetical protein Tco_0823895 [Tanacetum coccineum]|uniref:Uncharacterized protein n=1 Tax=Tanacetum coccineum TaxID=301880 RepID=A0ABQ5AK69_9ASTR